jgi:very-short-patch-repair endonuclease
VRSPKARLFAFRRISQKRVDYAIYTNKLELICIVELDDRTHDALRDAERDAFTASAGIATLRWQSTLKPGVEAIRAQFEKLRPADAFFSYRADGRGW